MEDPAGLAEVVSDCVHCGFCLPACPTYQLWGEEMDSPRGRIHLISQVLEGAPLTGQVVRHFDRCLGCMACMPACPSGVRYNVLIEAARTWTDDRPPRRVPVRPKKGPRTGAAGGGEDESAVIVGSLSSEQRQSHGHEAAPSGGGTAMVSGPGAGVPPAGTPGAGAGGAGTKAQRPAADAADSGGPASAAAGTRPGEAAPPAPQSRAGTTAPGQGADGGAEAAATGPQSGTGTTAHQPPTSVTTEAGSPAPGTGAPELEADGGPGTAGTGPQPGTGTTDHQSPTGATTEAARPAPGTGAGTHGPGSATGGSVTVGMSGAGGGTVGSPPVTAETGRGAGGSPVGTAEAGRGAVGGPAAARAGRGAAGGPAGQARAGFARSLRDRAVRAAIFATFPYPRRMRVLTRPLRLAQRTGLDRRLLHGPAGRWLPAEMRAALRIAPRATARPPALPARIPAQGPRRAVVGMLTGCVQDVFFAEVNAATARVLAAEGCEVVIPRGQGCCGALSLHSGRASEAAEFARRTIAQFERADVDAIVINSAGCGSAMKEYAALLAGGAAVQYGDGGSPAPTPGGPGDWAARAGAFCKKVRDLSEFLTELYERGGGPRAPRHELPIVAAYHDACHLAHAQRIRQQPRDLLRGIPGLEVAEVGDGGTCCGSAGVYNLLQPQAAAELGARKAAALRATGARLVVSANPGCSLQIGAAFAADGGEPVPVLHTAQVLDASLRALPVTALTGGRAD